MTSLTKSKDYGSKVTYGPIIASNLEQFRRLNRAIFPVKHLETLDFRLTQNL